MNSPGLINSGAFLADRNRKNLFLKDGYHISTAGVKWFPVVIRLYQSERERSRRAQIVEAVNPLGGSFLPFKHPWIIWLLDEQDQAAEHPRPSPLLQFPDQPSDWFLDVAWPKEMEGAASRLAFVIEPSSRIGCSRGECALGIPTHSFTSCAAISLSSHSRHINAFWSSIHNSTATLPSKKRQLLTRWSSHTVKEREKPSSSPHGCTHTHTLSSWMAAILVTSPNKVILMEEMWA